MPAEAIRPFTVSRRSDGVSRPSAGSGRPHSGVNLHVPEKARERSHGLLFFYSFMFFIVYVFNPSNPSHSKHLRDPNPNAFSSRSPWRIKPFFGRELYRQLILPGISRLEPHMGRQVVQMSTFGVLNIRPR